MKVILPTSSNVCFGNVICPLRLWPIIFFPSFAFPTVARTYIYVCIYDVSVVYVDLMAPSRYLFCSASAVFL